MSQYIPPKIDYLKFSFKDGSYVSPEFSSLNFNFSFKSTSSDLNAFIEVSQLYQEEAYTYVKECRSIIVGYKNNNVQTLKLPCSFGGIRDLGSFIHINPPNVDLKAYLNAVSNFKNLSVFIRSNFYGTEFLAANLRSHLRKSFDLSGILLGNYVEKDLYAYLNVIEVKDLLSSIIPNLLHGSIDLSAYSKSFYRQPKNLHSYLNIIEVRDLFSNIVPNLWHASSNLSAYSKSFFRYYKDFGVSLHSWDNKDLSAYIYQLYSKNLKANILATFYLDLPTSIYLIEPKNLLGNLHGWDSKDLLVKMVAVYGPGDLNTSINVVTGVDLKTSINAYRGLNVTSNLKASVSSFYTQELYAHLYVSLGNNLKANLNASGAASNLYARLFPKVVHVKKAFHVNLLSYKSLFCTINTTCLSTDYKDLKAFLHSYASVALNAHINMDDGYSGNLKAYINDRTDIVLNSININFIPITKYSSLNIKIQSDNAGLSYNTIDVLSSPYFRNAENLKAVIIATKYRTSFVGLTSELICYTDKIFNTNNIETKGNVLNLTYDSTLDWKRNIELYFNEQARYYRYVSSNKKVYRTNREKHWVIRVVGFSYRPGIGVEKGKVLTKYIFNLSKYKNIDEAIKDAIDRVSTFRKGNLKANLNVILSELPFKNLSSYIYSRYVGYGSSELKGRIRAMYKGIQRDILGSIVGKHLQINLEASIVGDYEYTSPKGDNIWFNFTEKDIVESLHKVVNLNFKNG